MFKYEIFRYLFQIHWENHFPLKSGIKHAVELYSIRIIDLENKSGLEK